ncbi:chaperonin 10-like protein [Desarmillaria tabescens]|uniref:Chaperonin 10-like protein n=1 Tax=Armillaria tabescens TaxID=1929756 RepID=A0AA39NID4_ARMTA|nr:chaperonin 10-like protein [Desarmillaria tabescens]KAK0466201.1 chaperonin 10-like protein [Desarmillaria tabescens]
MSTHVAIAAVAKGQFDEVHVPTQKPQQGEVLLKAEYASMVAFDTYVTDLGYATDTFPVVLGSSAAGTIVELGPSVDDLKVGDRVTAFAYQGSRSKAMQEYSIQSRTVCAKVPDSMPLAAAATIPDHFVAAFHTLFKHFPPVESPPSFFCSNSGSMALDLQPVNMLFQLLHTAGYKNVIVTASSKHHAYLTSLGATATIDYHSPSLAEDIAKAAGGDGKVMLAVDCITAEGTIAEVAEVALLLPVKEGNNVRGEGESQMYMEIPEGRNPFPKSVNVCGVRTFLYQELFVKNGFQKENVMPKILPELLEKGIIQPNRVHLLDEGSFKDRVAVGLDLLRHNKVSGEKLVVKIEV